MSNAGEVQVLFVAANGQQIGRGGLPIERVPPKFEIGATIEISGTFWVIERSSPETAAEIIATGMVMLTLSPSAHGPDPTPVAGGGGDSPRAEPTICGLLPPLVAIPPAPKGPAARFEIRREDWRQTEFVRHELAAEVVAELQAIRTIYEKFAHRDDAGRLAGFTATHTRSRPSSPLMGLVSLAALRSLLPSDARVLGPVGLRGQDGIVGGSFALEVGRVVVYGTADNDTTTTLGLLVAPGAVAEGETEVVGCVEHLMRSFNLMLVDWRRVAMVDADSVGHYLAAAS